MDKKLYALGLSLLIGTAQAQSLDELAPVEGSQGTDITYQPSRQIEQPALIQLGPLDQTKTSKLNRQPEAGQPMQVGVRRDVAALKSVSLTQAQLNWQPTASGGHIAAIEIASDDAIAVRLAITVGHLPSSATLSFYGANADEATVVHASEILALLQANREAGDLSAEASEYWSPMMSGETIGIEIELPAGIEPTNVAIGLPKISHFYRSLQTAKAIGDSSYCQIDVACSLDADRDLDNKSRATAKMTFIEDGDSYECSGTLLNNRKADRTPYLLSANHCISSQTVASTLITHWFFRADKCLYGVPKDTSTLSGGAKLLYNSSKTDTTLLQLNKPAPQGVVFAGWSTDLATQAWMRPVVGVHHPEGDLQKVSYGYIDDFLSCSELNSWGRFSCSPGNLASSNYISIRWQQGFTEVGSSGSGLFSDTRVIGQLLGGNSTCTGGTDTYGLLRPAYEDGLNKWLNPAGKPITVNGTVVEFYNPDQNRYFITGDAAEQQFVDGGGVGRWIRTGQSFKHGGDSSVCRFYGNTNVNPATGNIYGPPSHFYSVLQHECDSLIEIYDPTTLSWKFESYDFKSNKPDAEGTCPAQTKAVHRLYNNGFAKGIPSNHRYATSPAIIDQMIDEGWDYEGVKMCAPL